MTRVRIGNVAYLNATPLVYGLAADPAIEIVGEVPAMVASLVASGSLDVGLVPVVEAAAQGLLALDGIAVASRGPVRSVLLLHRRPLAKVRRLALDPASRTSVALTRLLLRRMHGIDPELIAGPATGNPLPDDADAALVIGDRALRAAPHDAVDLGAWWREHTGLPFVYALWAGRDAALLTRVAPGLRLAKQRGLADLDAIAKREAHVRGLDADIARAYLREAIVFELGREEHQGLEHFLALLQEEGLLGAAARIRFHSTSPS